MATQESAYYETSLWDLKLKGQVSANNYLILWDIPMGFETSILKIGVVQLMIMRHPYGIWNLFFLSAVVLLTALWDIPMGFETISSGSVSPDTTIMRHPYGIWNLVNNCLLAGIAWLWDIPMGFETSLRQYRQGLCWHYETSLWDLKLRMISVSTTTLTLWDIPMGFETAGKVFVSVEESIMRHPYGIWNNHSKWKGCNDRRLWDIPMGFETEYSTKNNKRSYIMRHPYGIWNLLPPRRADGVRALWDIPMGFETHYNTDHRYRGDHYETSLWDLKPT